MWIEQTQWKLLEVGKIYKIANYVVFEEKDRMRLVLQDGSQLYSLWAPDRVRYVLEGLELTHIRSNGKIDGAWSFDVAQEGSTMHS